METLFAEAYVAEEMKNVTFKISFPLLTTGAFLESKDIPNFHLVEIQPANKASRGHYYPS